MQKTTRLKKPQVPELSELVKFDEIVGRPKYAGAEMTSSTNIPSVTAETEARQAADQEIWTEINAIEASSDVVDVVGTYAELQQYDTSKLHDKDLIKVLQDETHDGAITYYRYSTTSEAFTYVGAEGPYYTTSETDVLLSGKQDKLIAGSNIQIASDGKTISATDTIYSVFTGATSLADGTSGLVPAPTTTDVDKFLKGDGTWGTVSTAANTIFYMNSSESGGTRHIYKNPDMTGAATSQEVFDANDQGQVILRISNSVTPEMYSDCYLQNAYKATGDYQLLFLDEKTYRSFDTTTLSADTFTYSARVLQDQLTAGSNITITGSTISATDTTYSAGDGISISAQNAISNDDAFVTAYIVGNIGSTEILYKDFEETEAWTFADFATAIKKTKNARILMTLGSGDNKSVQKYFTVTYFTPYNYGGANSVEFHIADIANDNAYKFRPRSSGTTWDVTQIVLQEELTAGTGINIDPSTNTISVTGGGGGGAAVFYYDYDDLINRIGSSSTLYFYSDTSLTDSVELADILDAANVGSVELVGVKYGNERYSSALVSSDAEGRESYNFKFYVSTEDGGVILVKAYDSSEYSSSLYIESTGLGITTFYYDYDAALAATSGDQISLYTKYEPRYGLDSSTELDDDRDLYSPMDGKTSFVLVGIYYDTRVAEYFIKCADTVISSTGSENATVHEESAYLSIIKDELPTKQIWKWAIDGNSDLCLFKSNLQPGTMVGATSQLAGTAGLVPAPTTSDTSKVLSGSGTWISVPSVNNISSNDWTALWQ